MDGLKRRAEALKQQHEELTRKIEVNEEKLASLQSKLEKSKEEMENLENIVNQKSQASDELRDEISSLQLNLIDLEKSNLEFQLVSSASSRRLPLTDRISNLQRQKDAAVAKNAELDKQIELYEQEVSGLEAKLNQLEEEKTDLSNSIKNSENECMKLTDELKHQHHSLEKSKQRSKSLEMHVKSLESRFTDEEKRRDTLTNTLNQLEAEILEYDAKISDDNNHYRELTEEWEKTILEMGAI